MQSTRSTALSRALRTAVRSHPHTAKRHTSSVALLSQRFQPQSQHQQHQPQNILSRPAASFTPSLTQQIRHASSSTTPQTDLQKTPLYDLHLSHGGKMVPFGGFYMPVQYSSLGVAQSHLFTRSHASLFDVSHMVQRLILGPGAAAFLERITPSDCKNLETHKSTLSALMTLDGKGGISDDTIITKLAEDKFYVVTNAGCRGKDNNYIDREMAKWNTEMGHEGLKVREEQLDGWGLVAVQGPKAEEILQGVLAEEGVDLKKLLFGGSLYAKVKYGGGKVSSPLLISRGGYTGEDGFEISIPPAETVGVTEAFLASGPEEIQLAGLGARDSLRLEAGMCLYGHDLNDSITPVEAGLSWIIPKERRSENAGYYGAGVIAKQLVPRSKGGAGVHRRRIGLLVEGAPAREGAEIVSRSEDGKEAISLGTVTSGCPSPSLGKNIAMGYIKDGFHKAGTEVDILVRGRPRKAVVTKMPFVPTKYWKGTAPA
ncbi:Aminomethyltransferase, mitochondrial [Podospora pseudocomata]|uniref:Aminomethyltransferase n=1 Tax=Podospora pseudocomata TaxID=2093779 RepID=A0ABR0GVK3_9PEZI|nr:Aminomethyltransferase, mitochondrial [Podospora pseudocomata]